MIFLRSPKSPNQKSANFLSSLYYRKNTISPCKEIRGKTVRNETRNTCHTYLKHETLLIIHRNLESMYSRVRVILAIKIGRTSFDRKISGSRLIQLFACTPKSYLACSDT